MGEVARAINELADSLLETRSMHHNILDSLADAVITVDAQCRVSYLHPAACRLFRCRPGEIVGQLYQTLFRADTNFSSLMTDTLFTWENLLLIVVIIVLSVWICYASTPIALKPPKWPGSPTRMSRKRLGHRKRRVKNSNTARS